MEGDKKQKLLSLRKQLIEVKAGIERAQDDISKGLFDAGAIRRGEILRELKREEKKIIVEINQLTKEEKG